MSSPLDAGRRSYVDRDARVSNFDASTFWVHTVSSPVAGITVVVSCYAEHWQATGGSSVLLETVAAKAMWVDTGARALLRWFRPNATFASVFAPFSLINSLSAFSVYDTQASHPGWGVATGGDASMGSNVNSISAGDPPIWSTECRHVQSGSLLSAGSSLVMHGAYIRQDSTALFLVRFDTPITLLSTVSSVGSTFRDSYLMLKCAVGVQNTAGSQFLLTNQALRSLLRYKFHFTGTDSLLVRGSVDNCYIGYIAQTGFTGASSQDTYASHAGWSEISNKEHYKNFGTDATTVGVRWRLGDSSANITLGSHPLLTLCLSGPRDDVFNFGAQVRGMFLTREVSTTTTGLLMATYVFSGPANLRQGGEVRTLDWAAVLTDLSSV